MGLIDTDWLQSFSALHECARRGELKGFDHAAYLRERGGLAHLLLEMLHVMLEPGQQPRRSLRAARALPIDVELNDRTLLRSLRTIDLSAEGLAVLVPGDRAPCAGQEVRIELGIPSGAPLRARARVMNVHPRESGARCGVLLLDLDARNMERLETLIFDIVLEHLREEMGSRGSASLR
jgi:hypothetical protein